MKMKLGKYLKISNETDSLALWNQQIALGIKTEDFNIHLGKEMLTQNCKATMILSIVGEIRVTIDGDDLLLETGDSLIIFGEQKFFTKEITNDSVTEYMTYED